MTDPDPTPQLEPLADKSAEERRRAFTEMLRRVEEEADREGTVTLDEVMAEMEQIIAEAEQRRRG
ncbi:hypothetical protein [Inquilinus limosus]|uniref:hypothetical protein n=1 Tax=Inquilinus limosus TaxID=171674 RepID=UPI00119827B2|nr:hypothetical protein [Inquilinus limosus]